MTMRSSSSMENCLKTILSTLVFNRDILFDQYKHNNFTMILSEATPKSQQSSKLKLGSLFFPSRSFSKNSEQLSPIKLGSAINSSTNSLLEVAPASKILSNLKEKWILNKSVQEMALNVSRSYAKESHLRESPSKDPNRLQELGGSALKTHQKNNLKLRAFQTNFIQEVLSTPLSQTDSNNARSKSQIEESILKSNKLIKLYKMSHKHRYFFRKKNNQPEEAMPNELQPNSKKAFQQQMPPDLYSYLNRRIKSEQVDSLPEEVIKVFLDSPKNSRKEQYINIKSRRFLLQKMKGDYHNCEEVNELKKDLSKLQIRKYIELKQDRYSSEYRKRGHSPYFAYLSLPSLQQKLVLQSQRRIKLNTDTPLF